MSLGERQTKQASVARSEGIGMSRRERITKELIVEPGTGANIAGRDPAWTGGPEFEELSGKQQGPDFWAGRHADITARPGGSWR